MKNLLIKPPEGSTHWSEGNGDRFAAYWRPNRGGYDCHIADPDHGWQDISDELPEYAIAIEQNGIIEGLPPLESIIRIVPGNTTIWDVAEQFVGVDCTLKAIFMTGDTQMVAVEHIENGVCCCFWASMVRTPEQVKAEERAKRIAEIAACMAEYKMVEEPNEKMMSLSTYLHDHGCRMAVKP